MQTFILFISNINFFNSSILNCFTTVKQYFTPASVFVCLGERINCCIGNSWLTTICSTTVQGTKYWDLKPIPKVTSLAVLPQSCDQSSVAWQSTHIYNLRAASTRPPTYLPFHLCFLSALNSTTCPLANNTSPRWTSLSSPDPDLCVKQECSL